MYHRLCWATMTANDFSTQTHLPWMKNRKIKGYHSRDLSKLHNSNPYPKHLTISHIPSHSARMLCESDTSRGADFVAINDYETLFCDMTENDWLMFATKSIFVPASIWRKRRWGMLGLDFRGETCCIVTSYQPRDTRLIKNGNRSCMDSIDIRPAS